MRPAAMLPVTIAYPTPRGMMVFHSVNRSPGLASFYLRTFPLSQWLPRAFVSFTVTGIARNFHPIPLTLSIPEERRASLRRYTGYSFVISYYSLFHPCRQLVWRYLRNVQGSF